VCGGVGVEVADDLRQERGQGEVPALLCSPQRGAKVPTIQKFVIENFKGIERVEIDLEEKACSPVLTLIGLNESGKTTILEAISHFVSGDKSVASIFEGPDATSSALSLIPMHRKAAFNGTIEISAHVLLDNADIQRITAMATKQSLSVDIEALKQPFDVTKPYKFEDSVLKKSFLSTWGFDLRTKSKRTGAFKKYKRPQGDSDKPDLWADVVSYLRESLQQVSYFPTFLVDMPPRIYLAEHEDETAINRHYRFVFQDVLDSMGEGLSLEKHVTNRIQEFKKSEKNPTWLSILFGSPTKGPIDSVFQKISSAITKEVLGSWRRVFQRSISANTITVEWNVDIEKDDLPYAVFYVSDGESRYAVNERSLGFRWFFSFLLFTGFKKAQQRKTIFVFDEPAANLHAKAQAELLKSFSKIASNGNKIIYSTHSHHMINPQWLASAYIVENSALDYDQSDNFGLDTKPTRISAIPYRQFVSAFPTRSSYFQPVIERLEYVTPDIVGAPPYLIVEGISDYYALSLAMKISGSTYRFRLMPGVGSGATGPLISQLLGQGSSFALLLDDDSEGRKAAERYREGWFLTGPAISTLASVSSDFCGNALEKLLGQDTTTLIQRRLDLQSKPSKRQVGWYLAEACAAPVTAMDALPASAVARLIRILDYFEAHFARAGGAE
jgi:predicted ATPase